MAILAVATVGFFVSYKARARDAERQQGIRTVVVTLQTARSTDEITEFEFADGAAVKASLNTYGSYAMSKAQTDHCYIYGHANGGADFFVAVQSEEDINTYFVDGTVDGKSVVDPTNPDRLTAITTTDGCASDANLTVSPTIIEGLDNNPYTIFLLN